jgi:hypothetical protein
MLSRWVFTVRKLHTCQLVMCRSRDRNGKERSRAIQHNCLYINLNNTRVEKKLYSREVMEERIYTWLSCNAIHQLVIPSGVPSIEQVLTIPDEWYERP